MQRTEMVFRGLGLKTPNQMCLRMSMRRRAGQGGPGHGAPAGGAGGLRAVRA